MLESLVASILNRVLGSYVENFDPKYLNIGLLSGDVTLGNLRLKRGVLDQLRLPIDVAEGHIGSLVLQIPYSNLKSKPVKIVLEDVFLLAAPDLNSDDEGYTRRRQQAKLDKLEAWELAERAQETVASQSPNSQTPSGEAQQQNFTSSLITKIVDNLQVTIKNIHLRYEDEDVALGATLGELSAVSTNNDWEPAFISTPGATTHKLATLDSLAFYVDSSPQGEFTHSQSQDALLKAFRDAIGDSIGKCDILRPINGQGFVTLNKMPENTSVPRARAELKFEELAIAVDRTQYIDLLGLATRFQTYFRIKETLQLRPTESISEAPLAWFKYAAETVLNNVREKNRVWTWDALQKRIKDMTKYIDLYKSRERSGMLSGADKQSFDEFEDQYDLDTLVLWRSAAKRILRTELVVSSQPLNQQNEKPTWSQWLWGGGKNPSEVSSSNGDTLSAEGGLTTEQREELLSVLDIPDTPTSEIAASQLLLEVDFSLRSAGVRLSSNNHPIASVGLGGVQARFESRPDSFMLTSSVAEVGVSDLGQNTEFKEVIKVRKQSSEESFGLDPVVDPTFSENDADESPFFWFLFEHHPLDHKVDSRLFVKSKSLVIVHNARFLEDVVAFFTAPPDQGDTVDAIINAANKTVEELREQTRIGLEYALENHKTLALQIDIQSPIIVIPLNPRAPDSPATILDVGSLSMTSDLASQEVVDQVKSKQAQRYTEADWKRLESLMYDRFNISLKDTQVLLGNSMRELRRCMGMSSSNLHFLDKATLNFLLEISIVPGTRSLPRSRLTIKLPSLRAALADVQYKLFMATLDASVPRFKTHEEIEESVYDQEFESSSADEEVIGTSTPRKAEHQDLTQPNLTQPSKDAQHLLEIVFVVNTVQLTLVRGWDAKALIELCLHDFRLAYHQAPDGIEVMCLDLTVGNLLINDFTNPHGPPELCKLAESAGHSTELQKADGASHRPLFEVTFNTKHDGSRACNISMDEINFVLNPTTVLTVYDYVMSTFAPPDNGSVPPSNNSSRTNLSTPQSNPKAGNDSSDPGSKFNVVKKAQPDELDVQNTTGMDVTIRLKRITALLNENNSIVAKLELASADMMVVLKDSLKFRSLLGAVSIINPENGQHLLSIEGGEDLADFRYETAPGPPGSGPALLYFRSASLKINVLEEPLAQMSGFFARFAAMKTIYDQSRSLAFGQAIQLEPTDFLLDVIVSAPIVHYPSNDDWLEAHLGELYLNNKFATNGENKVEAGIRGINLKAHLDASDNAILDDTNFSVSLSHLPGGVDRPLVVCRSLLSPVKAEISELHYRMIMQFLATIQRVGRSFGGPGEAEIGDLKRQLVYEKNLQPQQAATYWALNPVSLPKSTVGQDHLDFSFEAPLLSLSLNFGGNPLSDLKLEGTEAKVHINAKGLLEAQLHVRSLTVFDTRSLSTNKFPQIIPPAKHDGYQLMARVLLDPNTGPNVQVSLDSPQVLVALDYLAAVQKFASYGSITEESEAGEDEETSDDDSDVATDQNRYEDSVSLHSEEGIPPVVPSRPPVLPSRPGRDLAPPSTKKPAENSRGQISFNAVDMYLTVLADSSNPQTEAVVFKIEHLVANVGQKSSLSISKVSMYLTQMHAFDTNKLRILDDFSITGSSDVSGNTSDKKLTSVSMNVEPLVLRLSLREILLISQILQQALLLRNSVKSDDVRSTNKSTGRKRSRSSATTSRYTEDGRRPNDWKRTPDTSDGVVSTKYSQGNSTSLVRASDASKDFERDPVVFGEQATIEFEGFRIVIIDPAHQVPMADFVLKPFSVKARNWSANVNIDVSAELYANVYSFAKSAWEPLVDTLQLGLSIQPTVFELYTKNVTDIEITPEVLQLATDVQEYFSNAGNTFSLERHEDGYPYRIRNETGLPLEIWSASAGDKGEKRNLETGQEAKWSFFHWRQVRENLNATVQNVAIGISIPGFSPLESVSVNRVGEHLYALSSTEHSGPDGSKLRLVVDVSVDKHLKYIHIRSTEVICNDTSLDLEVLLTPAQFTDALSTSEEHILEIPVGGSCSLPLELIDSRILIRPKGKSQWSDNSLYWKNLLKGEALIRCQDADEDCWLRVIPEIPSVPLSRHYPYQRIHLTPPFQLVNNLPVKTEFKLFCRDTRKDITKILDAGSKVDLYDFNNQQLLLLSSKPEGYNNSDFAVVCEGRMKREFELEDIMDTHSILGDSRRQKLSLHIQYVDLSHQRGRVIVVYTPYLLVNRTDNELIVSTRINRAPLSPASAVMWSFESQTSGQRAMLRVSSDRSTDLPSHWSQPISFDTVGSAFETTLASRDRTAEFYVGVQPLQGTGRYATTKVVLLTPRFVINNLLSRSLIFREPGGKEYRSIDPGQCTPVGFISNVCNREMCVKFADSDNSLWSSAFAMANVGTMHVRLQEKGKPTTLVKVDVVLEGATLFAHVQPTEDWPFSIRNFTDMDFHFYQSNPFINNDTGEEYTFSGSIDDQERRFTPIKYHLPARSAMPYSWDFPAAETRELIIESNGKARRIQLAEIGELPPAKFGSNEVVDLNVVADGPQQALVINHHDPEESSYALRSTSSRASLNESTSGVNAEIKREAVEGAESDAKTFKIDLNGIGISYVTEKQELMYVSFRNVRVNYQTTQSLETLSWQVQWIQVDNCLSESTEFPVMVYPSIVAKTSEDMKKHPTFSGSVTRVRNDSYGLTYIKHATILLQEMTIETDEDFIVSAIQLLRSGEIEGWHMDGQLLPFDELLTTPIAPTKSSSEDLYFEQLHLQPVQLNLSFVRTGALSNTGYFGEFSGSSAYIIDALTMTIGNINDAPVRFNSLLVENVRSQPLPLVETVRTHYEQELLYQLHKIIGSADIIGNPVGLFNNISSGVADLFYEPYLGYTLTDRPQEFGVGLAKGGLSFMKKSVFGVSDSVAKVTGSLSKGIAAMTLDPHFQKQQSTRHSRNRPKHAVYGLKYGAESFYDSISSGFAGLASAPLQGAATGGTSGFFKGLGRGLVGLPTKTAIGVLDLASSISEGVRNTTTVFDDSAISRVRLPRVVYYDGLVRPYNTREAVGQMILHGVDDSAYSDDRYLAHGNITPDKVILVSLERSLVATMEGLKVEWMVTYDQLAKVTLESSGVSLQLKGGARGPFIPLTEADTRRYIYKNIAIAVAEYNRARTTLY